MLDKLKKKAAPFTPTPKQWFGSHVITVAVIIAFGIARTVLGA